MIRKTVPVNRIWEYIRHNVINNPPSLAQTQQTTQSSVGSNQRNLIPLPKTVGSSSTLHILSPDTQNGVAQDNGAVTSKSKTDFFFSRDLLVTKGNMCGTLPTVTTSGSAQNLKSEPLTGNDSAETFNNNGEGSSSQGNAILSTAGPTDKNNLTESQSKAISVTVTEKASSTTQKNVSIALTEKFTLNGVHTSGGIYCSDAEFNPSADSVFQIKIQGAQGDYENSSLFKVGNEVFQPKVKREKGKFLSDVPAENPQDQQHVQSTASTAQCIGKSTGNGKSSSTFDPSKFVDADGNPIQFRLGCSGNPDPNQIIVGESSGKEHFLTPITGTDDFPKGEINHLQIIVQPESPSTGSKRKSSSACLNSRKRQRTQNQKAAGQQIIYGILTRMDHLPQGQIQPVVSNFPFQGQPMQVMPGQYQIAQPILNQHAGYSDYNQFNQNQGMFQQHAGQQFYGQMYPQQPGFQNVQMQIQPQYGQPSGAQYVTQQPAAYNYQLQAEHYNQDILNRQAMIGNQLQAAKSFQYLQPANQAQAAQAAQASWYHQNAYQMQVAQASWYHQTVNQTQVAQASQYHQVVNQTQVAQASQYHQVVNQTQVAQNFHFQQQQVNQLQSVQYSQQQPVIVQGSGIFPQQQPMLQPEPVVYPQPVPLPVNEPRVVQPFQYHSVNENTSVVQAIPAAKNELTDQQHPRVGSQGLTLYPSFTESNNGQDSDSFQQNVQDAINSEHDAERMAVIETKSTNRSQPSEELTVSDTDVSSAQEFNDADFESPAEPLGTLYDENTSLVAQDAATLQLKEMFDTIEQLQCFTSQPNLAPVQPLEFTPPLSPDSKKKKEEAPELFSNQAESGSDVLSPSSVLPSSGPSSISTRLLTPPELPDYFNMAIPDRPQPKVVREMIHPNSTVFMPVVPHPDDQTLTPFIPKSLYVPTENISIRR